MPTVVPGRLLDLREGWVDDRLIEDEALYDVELERIFAEDWVLVAHETQLAEPGAFVTTYVGEDPLVVVRQQDGSISAFLNACRHRALQVCRPPTGIAAEFVCANHGWTYALSGELRRIGDMPAEPLIGPGIGLVPVAHLECRGGWVMVSWSDADPPTTPWGDLADRRPVGAPERVWLPVNWKTAAIHLRTRLGVDAASASLAGPFVSTATRSVHTLQPRGFGQTELTTWRLDGSDDAVDALIADLKGSDLRLPVLVDVVETRVSLRRASADEPSVDAPKPGHEEHDHGDAHSCAPPPVARPIVRRMLDPVGREIYAAWAARLDAATRDRIAAA